jgi:thiol:disulfide interchange protein
MRMGDPGGSARRLQPLCGVPLAALLALSITGCGRDLSDTQAFPEGAPTAKATAATQAPATPAKPASNAPHADAETWNAAQIDWQPYEAGLAQAKAQNKPVCLVLYTHWCPHCKNYSRVFDDAKIVEKARSFVMIRMNAEEHREVAQKYAVDGTYIPRTYFLGPDGALADVHAPRPKFKYFYDERNPGSLLAGMDEALRKITR